MFRRRKRIAQLLRLGWQLWNEHIKTINKILKKENCGIYQRKNKTASHFERETTWERIFNERLKTINDVDEKDSIDDVEKLSIAVGGAKWASPYSSPKKQNQSLVLWIEVSKLNRLKWELNKQVL